ncbi:hypothetical protein ABI59_21260 [Acidobacteria bacterium Mor1]|nr:hypothetical protein ABI59_21260 [Acidobacteria bacterium Mor1]
MTRRSWRFLGPALGLWLLLACAGCSGEGAGSGDPPLDPTTLEIPRADADTVDDTVRSLMAERQQEVQRALDADPFQAAAAAESFSALGKLYFAYEFYPAAGTCFANASALVGDDPRFAYYEGLVAQAIGEAASAAESFERADRLKAGDVPTLIRLGDAQFDRGEPALAGEAYGRALAVDADEAAAHFGLGRVDEEAGRVDQAIERFERTLELQPEASVVHYRLGQLYRRRGDLDRARGHLEQRGTRRVAFEDPLGREIGLLTVQTAFEVVRRLAENEPFDSSDAVGFAIAQFGDTTGAVEAFEKTLDDGGELAEVPRGRVHYVLASLYQRAGDYEQAVEHYQSALDRAPELTVSHERLAGLMLRFGNYERGLQHAREAIRHAPDAAVPQLRLGALLEAQGDAAGAFSAWKKATDLEPQNGEAWLRLALAREQRNEPAAAIEAYRRGLALETLDNEDRTIAFHRLGQMLLRGGDAAGAEAAWQAALDLDPKWPDPKVALAGLQAASGRLEQAVTAYGEVLADRPALSGARMGQAMALILLGRHEQAKTTLEAGLTLDDGNLDFARTLARHLAACPDRSVRDGNRALELAQRVARESSRLEDGETLAMAMAEAGQFDQAAGLQRSLLEQVKSAGAPPALVSRLEGNLALYQNGRSCCG